MNEIVITDTDFCRFRDYFYQKTGIFFENSKRYFVDKRLLQRIELTEHQSFRGYFTYLRFQASGEELQAVINALTVNETYFSARSVSWSPWLKRFWMTSYAIGQVS